MWVKRQKIKEYEQKIEELERRNNSNMLDKQRLEHKIDDCDSEITRLQAEKDQRNQKIFELENEIASMKEMGDSIQKENELLRKYYKLDEEPSDEIKAKMHIDLEINRLKDEIFKWTVMSNVAYRQPVYFPMGMGNFILQEGRSIYERHNI